MNSKLKDAIKSIVKEILESENIAHTLDEAKRKKKIKMKEAEMPAAVAAVSTPVEEPAAPEPEPEVASPESEEKPEEVPAVQAGMPSLYKGKAYKYLLGAMKAMIKNGTVIGVTEEEIEPMATELTKTLTKSVQERGMEKMGEKGEAKPEEPIEEPTEPKSEPEVPVTEPTVEPEPKAGQEVPSAETEPTEEEPSDEENKDELSESSNIKKLKKIIKEILEGEIEEYRTKGALGLKNRPDASQSVSKEKMISDMRMVVSKANLSKLEDIADMIGLTHIPSDEDVLFKAIQLKLDEMGKSQYEEDSRMLGNVYNILHEKGWLRESANQKFAFGSYTKRVKTLIKDEVKKNPNLLKEGKIVLFPLASNLNELVVGGKSMFFSYSTLIAYAEGNKIYVSRIDPSTNKPWSKTTSKHIGMIISRYSSLVPEEIPHDKLEQMAFAAA